MNGSDDSDDEGDINVDFDAVKPTPCDYWGIRCLLAQLFRDAPVDLSGLADVVIAQPEITSIIKIFDEAGGTETEAKDIVSA